MTNPYAPPQALVQDIADPLAPTAFADRGSRLGATLLDTVVFMVMVYGPIMVGAMIGVIGAGPQAARDNRGFNLIFGTGALGALLGLIVWLWLTIKYVRANGQSIGKKLVRIKVTRSDGSPVSLGRLFWLRNVVNGLLSLIPLYGFIDPLFIFGETRQCLHDRIADTVVMKA